MLPPAAQGRPSSSCCCSWCRQHHGTARWDHALLALESMRCKSGGVAQTTSVTDRARCGKQNLACVAWAKT